MKKSKFSEAQIVAALKELDAGTPATTLCPAARRPRQHAAGMVRQVRRLETSDLIRLKQLEAENAQMKRIIAREELELDAVRELIEKNGWGPQRARTQ